MSLKYFSALAFSMALVSCVSEPESSVGPFTVEALSDKVYHIEDYNEVRARGGANNCSDVFLIVGNKDALLIDLTNPVHRSWDSTAVESLQKIVADRIGKRKLTVTVTHNHGDHLGMLPAFYETADFWVPAADFEGTEIFPVERTVFFSEGETFALAKDMNVKTLTVPGHTKGSTVFYLENSPFLFTGDAVGSGTGVWLFSKEAFEQYAGGVEKLLAWIHDEANGVDKENLMLCLGHSWQKDSGLPEVESLGLQYLEDMKSLVDMIKSGNAPEPSANMAFMPYLNANFRHGQATITWNREDADSYRK